MAVNDSTGSEGRGLSRIFAETDGLLLALRDFGLTLEHSPLDPHTAALCCIALAEKLQAKNVEIGKQALTDDERSSLQRAQAALTKIARFTTQSLYYGSVDFDANPEKVDLDASRAWSTGELIASLTVQVARSLETIGEGHGISATGFWDGDGLSDAREEVMKRQSGAEVRRDIERVRAAQDIPAEERVRMIAENNAQIRWLARDFVKEAKRPEQRAPAASETKASPSARSPRLRAIAEGINAAH